MPCHRPERRGKKQLLAERGEGTSEQEVLFAMIGGQAQAHLRRAVSAFDGQLQDQQGLIQAAVVELGRSAQDVGDQAVSDFKFFEDGEFQ